MEDKKSTCTNIKPAYRDLYLVLKTQVAEYKNNPLLNLGFIVSLAIATSTLLSILILNHASKQQYQQANLQLINPVAFHIVAKPGAKLTKDDFSTLRKQGFTQITPVLTFIKKLANGKRISFRAIDMLALSIMKPESFNSQTVLLNQTYRDTLFLSEGVNTKQVKKTKNTDMSSQAAAHNHFVLADQRFIAFSLTAAEQWGNAALLDIALAWQLFPEEGDFSYLMVAPLSKKNKQQLESALPGHLTLYKPWSVEERLGLADALHLNLNVLAILGFIMSMFIAFQAGSQAWRKRGKLAAQLRLLGVQLQTLKIAMSIELLFLLITASGLGILITAVLVSALLPLVGLTLSQIYLLNSSGHFVWQWQYVIWALIISSSAVLLALFKQFKLISTAHIALSARASTERFPYLQTSAAGIILLLLFLLWPGGNWFQLMAKYGLLLTASVALLPSFLQLVLFVSGYLLKSFRLKYIFKDAAKQIARRYLPLAAFYLALTSSIAAALMVNSFEAAFDKYIDQQLSSDIIIRHKSWQNQQVVEWLNNKSEVEQYILFQHTRAQVDNEPVKVLSYQSARQLESLLFKSSSNTLDEGCYINEQLALKKQLSVDQGLLLSQGGKQYKCKIKGIYYDYGYPGLSATLKKQRISKLFDGWVDTGFGVFFKEGQLINKQDMLMTADLEEQQIYEPQQIKKQALAIFSQTFVLMNTIVALLLSIACLGLFLSANSLELARKTDLYILCSLGYSKMELFTHMLIQWLLLALGTILLSWPIAVILADALVSKVLPASFGWSMPLMLNVAPFAVSSSLALLFLIPALTVPLFKLNVRSSL
ncbi:FtsX-like permease family protein [Psychromonas ossibalaenae]|uniref:FtsX-like permease family protein n=1 Tax=Psychromonas ossibalaenae TaxID=444922 RepID=UPI00036E9381|nr:FtsX-like permease family protein [Psychromonas ossibalaenae]